MYTCEWNLLLVVDFATLLNWLTALYIWTLNFAGLWNNTFVIDRRFQRGSVAETLTEDNVRYRATNPHGTMSSFNYSTYVLSSCRSHWHCIIRPLGTTVPNGRIFYPWCFLSFFLYAAKSPRSESGWNRRIRSKNLGGRSPKNIGGQKHEKISVDFFCNVQLWLRISPERLKISKS